MRQKNESESLSKTMAMIEMRWRAAASFNNSMQRSAFRAALGAST